MLSIKGHMDTTIFSLTSGGSCCIRRGLKPEQGAEPPHFKHCSKDVGYMYAVSAADTSNSYQ